MTREIELREHPTPQLRGVVDGGIGWIIYNQPERHNAMSRAMLAAIPELCRVMDEDDDVRVRPLPLPALPPLPTAGRRRSPTERELVLHR